MYKQDDFGIKKYNTPLHYALDYDWEAMQDEELADFLKYRECAKQRKQVVIDLLEGAMLADNPKDYIIQALGLLTVKGTGK